MRKAASSAGAGNAPTAHVWTRGDIALLVALTVCWGLNWPIMKVGVTGLPPFLFRALNYALGLPLLLVVVLALRTPLAIPRVHWRRVLWLAFLNMMVWNVVAILSLQALSSGRAAILGYTMPIFSAIWGAAFYGERLGPRHVLGVGACLAGVGLLLWHEMGRLAGQPWAAIGMLASAAVWAYGTQELRRSTLPVPTMALIFWMTTATGVGLVLMSVVFEWRRWHAPSTLQWGAIAYNAVFIIALAQPIWLVLARRLPPLASTMSVMLIPVLGVASGAWWLGETLHWQDHAAVLLLLLAIASVMWPARRPADPTQLP